MKWTPGTENDDVVDMRGASGGGGGGGGGGVGMRLGGGGLVAAIVVALVARVFGVDVTGLFGGHGQSSSPSQSQSQTPQPRTGEDPDKKLVDFVKFVMKDVQTTFDGLFKADGRQYRHAKLVVFASVIDTGCGRSSAEIGPFYCPPDEEAYIDLSFYQELRERFGAPGEFAKAYVLAHELGHHLQNLLGIEKAQLHFAGTSKRERNAQSVKLELQADCFAGVWGHSANERKILDVGDLDQALTAASAIGDDRLQQQAGMNPNAETFTHGTSEQRKRWFKRGFDTGRLDQCDTFAASTL